MELCFVAKQRNKVTSIVLCTIRRLTGTQAEKPTNSSVETAAEKWLNWNIQCPLFLFCEFLCRSLYTVVVVVVVVVPSTTDRTKE
jgi:hypothetical protein